MKLENFKYLFYKTNVWWNANVCVGGGAKENKAVEKPNMGEMFFFERVCPIMKHIL